MEPKTKIEIITGLWGLISAILSMDNIRHTEKLFWFSGSLFEKIIFLPAYLTNVIGNPFMPISKGEGAIGISTSAIGYHVLTSVLIGFVIGYGITLLVQKFEK